MVNRLWLACALMYFLIGPVAAQPASHDHGGHGGMGQQSVSGECQNPAAPSLKCARMVSGDFDKEGNLWLAWEQNGHVYVQSSSDKGRTLTSPVPVNRIPEPVISQGENRPKIKRGPEGNLYVTWTRKLDKRFTSHVRFSRSVDGGRSFSEPIILNDNKDIIGHSFDSLAVSRDGKLFIAWLDARDMAAAQKQGKAFNGTSLYYTWSDDGGRSFHPDKKIADSTCQCCRLQTAFDKDGLPVVIWRHIFHDNIRDHALVKFEDWSRPAPLVRLSRENWRIDACPHHGPGLSIGEDGRYHAVWFNNAPEFHGLFYAYSNDHGQHFSVPLRFGDYEKGAAHPHVLSQGEKVTVVWKEFDGKSTRILSMESPDGGVSWYDPKIVARTSGSSDNPFLLTDSEHRYLSWQTEKEGYRLLDLDQNALAFKNP